MEWQQQSEQRDTRGFLKRRGGKRFGRATALMPTGRTSSRGRVSVRCWLGESVVNAGPGVVENRISHISKVAGFDRSSFVFWEMCGDANKTQISLLKSVKLKTTWRAGWQDVMLFKITSGPEKLPKSAIMECLTQIWVFQKDHNVYFGANSLTDVYQTPRFIISRQEGKATLRITVEQVAIKHDLITFFTTPSPVAIMISFFILIKHS